MWNSCSRRVASRVRVLACMASCNGSRRASAPGVKGRLRSKAAEARMNLGISPSLPEDFTPVLVMQRNYLSSRCSRTVSRKCGIYAAAKGLLVVASFGEQGYANFAEVRLPRTRVTRARKVGTLRDTGPRLPLYLPGLPASLQPLPSRHSCL
jgi:hypothetical protein